MKQIFIINGLAGAGKDTFVEFVMKYCNAINYSSIDTLKEISMNFFDYKEDRKSDKDRKFLSDFKALVDDYCDFSFKEALEVVNHFLNEDEKDEILFIHVREPQKIDRMKKMFKAKTILVTTNRDIHKVTNNDSDANVENYKYDIVIENNGTKEELEKYTKGFVKALYKSNFNHIL